MAKREETYDQQRAKYKFFVVDVQHICIASGWEFREDAMDEAVTADAEGRGPVKVMTKPAVGGQQLDPKDPASWVPRRNAGPAYASSARHVQAPRPTYQQHGPGIRQNPRAPGYASFVCPGCGAKGSSPRVEHKPGCRLAQPVRRPRHNPGELLVVNDGGGGHDSARAERVFEMWHKKSPTRVQVVRPRLDEGDEMVCVGKACDIVYRSGKWEKGRKTNDYVHTFDSRPSVYMLASIAPGAPRDNPGKTVGSLLGGARNRDGQFAVAELATPLSLSLHNGQLEGDDVAIHSGSKVYGGVDKKTVIIMDPQWKIIVIKGGSMHFDERGIVK